MDRLAGDDSYLAILTYTETPAHIYQWIYKGGKIVFYKEWTQTGVEHYVYDKEDIVFGKLDLVVMDIETYNRREKMLKLREELLAVEEDRIAGRNGCTLDELDAYLDDVIADPLRLWALSNTPV